MLRWTVLLVSLAVLALTFAALDDITTGRQPGFVLEWAMVVAAALWFSTLGAAIAWRWRARR